LETAGPHGDSGAPVNLRPWGGAPSTRLAVAQLQVASDCFGSGPGRQIGNRVGHGVLLRRRRCAAQGGEVRGGGEEQGRAGTQAAAFIGAWGSPDLGTHAKASSLAAGRWPCWARLWWPDGLRWAGGLGRCGRSGLGRASGSAQSGRVDFLFFSKYFFSAKTNSGNAQKMFRGTKKYPENHKNSRKISRDN
jgi:hypothetical protein